MSPSRDRSGTVPDTAILAVLAVVFSVAAAVWAGAALAATVTGDRFTGTLPDAIRVIPQLPRNLTNPANAWPAVIAGSLPGPLIYWPATLATTTIAAAVAVLIRRVSRTGRPTPRSLLGVETSARFATRRELASLHITDPASIGRFVLGTVNGHLVATEDRQHSPATSRAGRARQGNRGAVAIIGPSQCGKTTNVMASLIDWTGPAIVISTKRDLYDATRHYRANRGTVHVFDPAGISGLPTEHLARWSPTRTATTSAGAQRAAATIVATIPTSGVEDRDFWTDQAEGLLAGTLTAAALDPSRTIRDVITWIFTRDKPTVANTDTGSDIARILADATRHGTPSEQRAAADALLQLRAVWASEERALSSIYSTVHGGIRVWLDEHVEASAHPHPDHGYITLDTIINAANTLYLIAPLHEQDRYRPVLGGILSDLKDQLYTHDLTHGPLTRPLLLLLDEAGNMPLDWLPEVVATCASIGVQLVTIWQSKAQMDAAYGRLADSILTNHLTKIVFSGCSDPATLDYTCRLLGKTDTPRTTTNRTDDGRHSTSETTTHDHLTPWHTLRQAPHSTAILIHGTLPPTILHGRRPPVPSNGRTHSAQEQSGEPSSPNDADQAPTVLRQPGRHLQ